MRQCVRRTTWFDDQAVCLEFPTIINVKSLQGILRQDRYHSYLGRREHSEGRPPGSRPSARIDIGARYKVV